MYIIYPGRIKRGRRTAALAPTVYRRTAVLAPTVYRRTAVPVVPMRDAVPTPEKRLCRPRTVSVAPPRSPRRCIGAPPPPLFRGEMPFPRRKNDFAFRAPFPSHCRARPDGVPAHRCPRCSESRCRSHAVKTALPSAHRFRRTAALAPTVYRRTAAPVVPRRDAVPTQKKRLCLPRTVSVALPRSPRRCTGAPLPPLFRVEMPFPRRKNGFAVRAPSPSHCRARPDGIPSHRRAHPDGVPAHRRPRCFDARCRSHAGKTALPSAHRFRRTAALAPTVYRRFSASDFCAAVSSERASFR